jgi:hypothetical protein
MVFTATNLKSNLRNIGGEAFEAGLPPETHSSSSVASSRAWLAGSRSTCLVIARAAFDSGLKDLGSPILRVSASDTASNVIAITQLAMLLLGFAPYPTAGSCARFAMLATASILLRRLVIVGPRDGLHGHQFKDKLQASRDALHLARSRSVRSFGSSVRAQHVWS